MSAGSTRDNADCVSLPLQLLRLRYAYPGIIYTFLILTKFAHQSCDLVLRIKRSSKIVQRLVFFIGAPARTFFFGHKGLPAKLDDLLFSDRHIYF